MKNMKFLIVITHSDNSSHPERILVEIESERYNYAEAEDLARVRAHSSFRETRPGALISNIETLIVDKTIKI